MRLKIQTTFIYLAAVTLIYMVKKCPNINAKEIVDGVEEASGLIYGADISFPMHHGKVSTNYPWLPHNIDPENNPVPDEYKDMPIQPLGNRQKFYDDFMKGCRDYYQNDRPKICDKTEEDRAISNLQQTQYMKNFTDTGFKKIRTPEKAFNAIKGFWEKHRHDEVFEGDDNTYVNCWESPPYMVNFEDVRFYEEGEKVKEVVWDATLDIIQDWIGQELEQVALYGIRVYKEGAVLIPHVDTLPRVASAIINVAQDMDEDWPVEMIGHDGRAYNVTMQPGDMVLYESHSTIHGRPFALKGRYYANAFIHFKPKSNSNTNELPDYIEGGSWRYYDDELMLNEEFDDQYETDEFQAHTAAANGDLERLSEIASEDIEMLHVSDENGWQPIHEAAAVGHEDIVELLIKNGANVNERTTDGLTGGTPLYWALAYHEEDHPVVTLLKRHGAVYIEPESEL